MSCPAACAWMSCSSRERAGFLDVLCRFFLDVLRWLYAGFPGCPTLVGGTGYLSTRKMPDLSFGSNQVDLGGITRSASATAMRSSIAVG